MANQDNHVAGNALMVTQALINSQIMENDIQIIPSPVSYLICLCSRSCADLNISGSWCG